jgi:small subunit ribosomal protein S24e
MKAEIIEERDNPILKRKEIKMVIEHIDSATPPRVEIKKLLKALKDYDENKMVIKEVRNIFGIGKDEVTIFVYEDEELMKKLEPKYLFEREIEEKAE